MKIDALDHPKTIELATQLGVCIPQAIGHLELLWAFVAQKTPRGNIGRWSDAVIANSAQWTEEPKRFVKALIDSGFCDPDSEHRVLIHDWPEHCPNWVRSKLKREGKPFLTADLSQELTPNITGHYKPSQAKPNQVMPETESTSTHRRCASRFDEFWDEYPKKIEKKKAKQKWKSRNLDCIADQIIEDIKTRKAKDRKWLDGYIPNPTTYINGDRWEDEIQERPNGNQKGRNGSGGTVVSQATRNKQAAAEYFGKSRTGDGGVLADDG